jgi:hypothetical protein
MNALLLSLALAAAPAVKSAPAPVAKPAVTSDACEGDADSKTEAGECHHAPTSAAPMASGGDAVLLTRGEKLKGLTPVKLESLLATPADYEGKSVSVTAKVRKSCERKGCWLELASSDKAPGVRVTFKDYGFFVPLDSAGKTAKVEGLVKVAELSPERAKHYESEGALVAKDKNGKYREVQLVAEGVELRK